MTNDENRPRDGAVSATDLSCRPSSFASPADGRSLQYAVLFCTVVVLAFLFGCERVGHWFVIPVWCCGVLVARDAIEWLRGRLDLFDPAGIIGVLGIHFFFVAPLLHVEWDTWLDYMDDSRDWRGWLGAMAVLNAAGLLLYIAARERASQWGERATARTFWRLHRPRFVWAAVIAMIVSGLLQCWVYARSGGIGGYLELMTESIFDPTSENTMAGMGWIFMVSESFPIVAMILFAVVARGSARAERWGVIVLVLAGYFVAKMFFGGLRGSRATTIWAVFWAVGIVHVWIRPVTRKFVLAGLCFMVAFMYLYGFYKGLGTRAWEAIQDGATASELTAKTHRTIDSVLLWDLARADVQAYVLNRVWRHDTDYHYAWGRTYLGSIALLVPASIWPDRPPIKTKEGTDLFFGPGTYDEGKMYSSCLYGIAGEAMLNFGPFAVPLAYLVFGLIVGRLQRFRQMLRDGDMRLLLYPLLVNLCFSLLQSDSDNIVFNSLKDGLVPILVLWFGSRVVASSEATDFGSSPTAACLESP